ncbi:MAG TPA: hypothetical protein VGI78_06375 [Acetobacteraceae bacterium]
MRKLLLSAAVLTLAAAPAFAHQPTTQQAQATLAASGAAVGSIQGTQAGAMVGGNAAVVAGAVSGNYTSVTTNGHAGTGTNGTTTNAAATQTNIGGTVAGGYSQVGKGFMGMPTGVAAGAASGSQTSVGLGGSIAIGGQGSKTATTRPLTD